MLHYHSIFLKADDYWRRQTFDGASLEHVVIKLLDTRVELRRLPKQGQGAIDHDGEVRYNCKVIVRHRLDQGRELKVLDGVHKARDRRGVVTLIRNLFMDPQ